MAKKLFRACVLLACLSVSLTKASAYTLTGSQGTLNLNSSFYRYPYDFGGGDSSPAVSGQDNFAFNESPFVSQSISKTVTASPAFATGAVSYAATADGWDFHMDLDSQYQAQYNYGPTHGTSIASADADLVLEFNLDVSTLLELSFSESDRPYIGTSYNFYDSYNANIFAKLEYWNGSAWTTFFQANSGLGFQNPDNGGVYFTDTVEAGLYRFSLDGWASQGQAIADGSIRLTPVPEPSGALLLMAAGCLFLCRRTTRSRAMAMV